MNKASLRTQFYEILAMAHTGFAGDLSNMLGVLPDGVSVTMVSPRLSKMSTIGSIEQLVIGWPSQLL